MSSSTASVTLRVVQGRLRPEQYVFEERTTCVIGRADGCSPQIPDDAHHRKVSRHHCLLDISPPQARIRDFGSLNGTYLNGHRIGRRAAGLSAEEAAGESYPEHDLADGDEIRLGDTVFRVLIQAPAKKTVEVTSIADPRTVAERLLVLAGERTDLASIAGYAVLRELGRGGNGAVYLARREHDAPIALKIMLPRAAADAEARARFLREVELTRQLRHPNVAALFEAGEAEGSYYFTIEYCDGGSLADLPQPLPVADAVAFTLQALDGLEYAHSRGVVHRDLSPHNVLLSGGVAKIADFGLAKAFDQAGLSGLTRTGTVAGKPSYVPRQQMINFRDARPSADVWSLTACLYRALTGHSPRDFPPGRDPWLVVLQDPAVRIRDRDPRIPAPLAAVIDAALYEDPTRSDGTGADITTAAELRQALRAAVRPSSSGGAR